MKSGLDFTSGCVLDADMDNTELIKLLDKLVTKPAPDIAHLIVIFDL
jgi:hypothetical protein